MIETVRTERRRERKRTLVALLVSLLIHLLILLAAVLVLSLHPEWMPRSEPVVPAPELTELTLMDPEPSPTPPPEAAPTPKLERAFFDSAQGVVSETAPENAAFESDRNTVAASEQPPTGAEPLPSQQGEDSAQVSLRDQQFTLGPIREPAPSAPAAPAQAAVPEKPQPTATPAPTVEPTATPKPKPRPEDAELGLLEPPKPTPTPVATPRPEPSARPQPPVRPSAPQPPGYQPQTRVTRLTGGISNRGRSSLDSVATPLGRYKKMLSDAIGSRWYYYVNDMLDLVGVGTVEMRFVVRADGNVERVQVLRNTSNESLASCSVRAIVEAEIPPIPPDVVAIIEGGKLEVDYSFTIIGR